MRNFSENKKIVISAIAIFILSFSIILFFLGGDNSFKDGNTSVLHSSEDEIKAEIIDKSTYLDGLEPVFVTNPEGLITDANRVFCSLIAVKCPELIGGKLFEHVNKEDLANFAADFTGMVQKKEKLDGIGPYRLTGKNSEKLVLLSAKPVLEKEKIKEIWFSVKDISDKVNEFKQNRARKLKNKTKTWIEKIYPSIDELKDDDTKLLVDKVSYKK